MDRAGRLARFSVKPGNAAECNELSTLLDGITTGEVVADKAYDSDAIRLSLALFGIVTTIPPRSNRKKWRDYDPDRYKKRHVVENFIAHLKQFRGIATRYCKLFCRFVAFLCLAGWFLATKGG